MQTEIFDIQGMSCDACVGHVTRALTGLDGVQSAIVSLQDHKAVVTYDPSLVQAEQMQEAVADEGYEATPRV
jgi:copper chaperone CopZ